MPMKKVSIHSSQDASLEAEGGRKVGEMSRPKGKRMNIAKGGKRHGQSQLQGLWKAQEEAMSLEVKPIVNPSSSTTTQGLSSGATPVMNAGDIAALEAALAAKTKEIEALE